MPETRDITKWPGARIDTPDQREEVVRAYGARHVAVCRRCGEEYFSPKLKSETCWGCWYMEELESAERIYQDVVDAIRAAGAKAEITQTGGMCLAICIGGGHGYYMLLTNADDVLSWQREPEDGWTLGVYDGADEEGDGMPLPLFGGEDYLSDEVKSAETAARLVSEAFVQLNRHKRSRR